jgi:hypothetical protein
VNRAHWIDYQTYAFNILTKNDLTGLEFDCQQLADGTCHCAYPSSLQAAGECKLKGEDVLNVSTLESPDALTLVLTLVCVKGA